MYFFYFDESGSRDPSAGTAENPKDHIYVLLAVGMYERQWHPFEREISQLKLDLAARLRRDGIGHFDLANCEVKSSWLRRSRERRGASIFLHALEPDELQSLSNIYFEQVSKRSAVVMATVVDKHYLCADTTAEALHRRTYELLLERVQNYIRGNHPRHQALIVMDDTDKGLNRAIAMQHSLFQWVGNRNMAFPDIFEYPFFTRSELSNGVQLADQLAYNVYRAFRYEDTSYPYFEKLLPHFYQSKDGTVLHGLKVWPDDSPLVALARNAWEDCKQKALRQEGD